MGSPRSGGQSFQLSQFFFVYKLIERGGGGEPGSPIYTEPPRLTELAVL